MRASLSAEGRAAPRAPTGLNSDAPGVYVTAADLAALEGAARQINFRPKHPIRNLMAGRHTSRLRGRGLDFEELRQYLPGDDVRTIDWHVTARMPKPYVRVYTEEKDRPATVVVDQRINMFFGTRLAMKSVTAAEAAAIAAWRVALDGDRVGSVVFDDHGVHQQRPERSRGAVLRMLGTLAACNMALRADARAHRNPGQLNAALDAVARVAHHDHLIIVVTDCDGHDAATEDLLRRLVQHNDVIVALVYDPFLSTLPESGELVASDGALQVEIPFGSGHVRRSIADAADAGLKKVFGWKEQIGVTVVPLSTAEETAAQLRHLLARASARGARR